jgi:hypothetical protein
VDPIVQQLQDPVFWFTAVLVAFLINVIASFVMDPVGALLAFGIRPDRELA